jgi:chromosome partitioning protein
MKTIGFFNNKGGVGKTSLVYHIAWMLAQFDVRVVVADLDPQANLTSMFLDEERLEAIWASQPKPTIQTAIAPLFAGTGDVQTPALEMIGDCIALIVGDLELSRFEDDLSSAWPLCSDRKERGFRVISAFAREIATASAGFDAEIALVDVGPNLGALNRAALLACDYVVVPLGADLFSLQGLRNMGPTLRIWREEWAERRQRNPEPSLLLPAGQMMPVGYIVMRHSVRLDRPVKAYDRWIRQIPAQYREYVLAAPAAQPDDVDNDPNCLARLKDYRSLMPMAQEARKPMFLLRPADGAFGSHAVAVQECYRNFVDLVNTILPRCGLPTLLDRML